MMADISHQLKTPLTAMRLMISSIRKLEGTGADEIRQRERRLTEMQQLVDRVDSLVVVLLKMAKLDSGTAILQKERISIKELILHSAEPLAISMDLHGVKLCLNGNDTDSFQGDFRWSAEAITNILKNGIEHMENGGNLYVSWSEKSVYSEIEIEDEGSGISDEELPHILSDFTEEKRRATADLELVWQWHRVSLQNKMEQLRRKTERRVAQNLSFMCASDKIVTEK